MSCESTHDCKLCQKGTVYLRNPLASGVAAKVCVLCDSPCATCEYHPTSCSSCKDGYFLFGTQCVTNSFYEGFVRVSTNVNTFSSNYQSFIDQIVSAL